MRTLSELEDAARLAPICGGTMSSQGLQVCLALKTQLKTPQDSKRIDTLIQVWRAALQRHNAQPVKFAEYDIETGLPLRNFNHEQ